MCIINSPETGKYWSGDIVHVSLSAETLGERNRFDVGSFDGEPTGQQALFHAASILSQRGMLKGEAELFSIIAEASYDCGCVGEGCIGEVYHNDEDEMFNVEVYENNLNELEIN